MTVALTIPQFMLVTDRLRASGSIVDVVRAAVEGGVQAIQIREKDLPVASLRDLTRKIRDALPPGIPVVVNGSPEIAAELGVGLHCAETASIADLDLSKLTSGALVGRSVHSISSARLSGVADYLIAGHVFETGSKAGVPVLGLDRLAAIVNAAPCPVLAIGGITPERVEQVVATGAHGIAVMSGICGSVDPRGQAREYLSALKGAAMTDTNEAGPESITVQVNGKPAVLPRGSTIGGFLKQKGLHQNMVVVEHNGHILKKGQFADVEVKAGDALEVVHFVGGG